MEYYVILFWIFFFFLYFLLAFLHRDRPESISTTRIVGSNTERNSSPFVKMGNLENAASIVIAGIVGIIGGVYLGKELQKTKDAGIAKEHNRITMKVEADADEEYDDEEDDEDDTGILVNSTGLNDIGGEVRMALIVRSDLGMLKGKSAAQCAHAAVSLYRQMHDYPESEGHNPEMLRRWANGGQAKIVLKCRNLEEMEELLMKAVSLNINNYLVVDAGRTQIASGSETVLGLGPAPRSVLDLVTQELKLY